MANEVKHNKHYFKSDGNGGFCIGKMTLTTIISIITLLSIFAGIVIAQTTAINNIGYLQTSFEDNAKETEKILVTYDELIKQLNTENREQYIAIATINTKLDNINQGINEIKETLKTI